MGLSNKIVWLIVVPMAIALIWLVGLQSSLLADALETQETSFRTNVLAAMEAVIERLEASEATYATMYVFGNANDLTVTANTYLGDSTDLRVDADNEFNRILEHESGIQVLTDTGHFDVADTSRIPLSDLPNRSLLVEAFSLKDRDLEADSAVVVIQYSGEGVDSATVPPHLELTDTAGHEVTYDTRVQYVSRVMKRLAMGTQEPILERVDTLSLDSLLRAELEDHGVTIEPVIGIVNNSDDSLYYARPSGHNDELLTSEFRSLFFPNDLLSTTNSLVLAFPDRDVFLWRQIGPMVASITLFMLVIVLGFGYTIRTIVNQRRTARLMVDFVNNMTHEFKTPISTVALACEAIMRPDVMDRPEQVSRFSKMIHDENRRMRQQTEKILQMAALEESGAELKLDRVDLHTVIREAAEGISLQVESREGRIELDLACSDPVVNGDRVHLSGVIYNLLDNANKYSPERPYITVRTADEPGGIRVSVQDRGMGLRPEDQKRIFQKYFRVPRGNVHDVKGFGLGLSYVHLIVRAHGGKIEVDSEPGKGTRISFVMPRADDRKRRKGER